MAILLILVIFRDTIHDTLNKHVYI